MEPCVVVERDNEDFLPNQPKEHWRIPLVEWKGFWFAPDVLKGIIAVREQFNPQPSDIIIASFPKTGTTWLKALTVAILNRHKGGGDCADDPLQDHNPHELVPHLEIQCFGNNTATNTTTTDQRVFNTHMPYSCLPEQVKKSSCRVIYISRNPADTFVSSWHFYNELFGDTISFQDDLEAFCNGRYVYGSYFNHVLEYWKESRHNKNVLFLTYEELKEDAEKHVKRLADFLGCSLNVGEIEKVVSECGFDKLVASSNNIERLHSAGLKYSSFFRKGLVGDWKNVLTPEMLKRLVDAAAQHWDGTGLEFRPTDN